jgi:hypothetical protein
MRVVSEQLSVVSKDTPLYLVAKFIAATPKGIAWEFQGVFDTHVKAVAACRTPMYCIQTVTLNQEIPDESHEFSDCEYPLFTDHCSLSTAHCSPEAN